MRSNLYYQYLIKGGRCHLGKRLLIRNQDVDDSRSVCRTDIPGTLTKFDHESSIMTTDVSLKIVNN